MVSLKITDNFVSRLRWLMITVIFLTTILTLLGQPQSYWGHPGTAIRCDGLSVYNSVNHTFDFFLSKGWWAYVATKLVFCIIAVAIVSVIHPWPAVCIMFSVIFPNYYISCNWLAVRWHFGLVTPNLYGALLGLGIAWSVSNLPNPTVNNMIKRLRWLMIGIMMLDGFNTLLGQPASFWHHPETAYEGNPFFRWFLLHGWWAYVMVEIVYWSCAFFIVALLQKAPAFAVVFAFIFGHYLGASNWFFYVWRMGMEVLVLFGVIVSVIIASITISFKPSDLIRRHSG